MSSDGGGGLTQQVVDALAAERRRQGRSLDDVAQAADLHRTSLGLIERHKRGVTLEVAGRIAQALGLSLGAVVTQAEGRQAELATTD